MKTTVVFLNLVIQFPRELSERWCRKFAGSVIHKGIIKYTKFPRCNSEPGNGFNTSSVRNATACSWSMCQRISLVTIRQLMKA